MKQHFSPTLLLAVLLLAAGSLHAGTIPGQGDRPSMAPPAPFTEQYLSGTIIIKLRNGVPNERGAIGFGIPALDAILERLGAEERRPLFPLAPHVVDNRNSVPTKESEKGFDRVYVIHYNSPYDAAWAAEQIAAISEIQYAEPYYIFAYEALPNDPRLAQQYWATITKLKEAWERTKGDTNVVIAICDSGVDWDHEDLAANIYTNPGESGKDANNADRRTNGVDDDANGKIDDWHGWDLVGNPRTVAELQSGAFRPDNDASPQFKNVQGWMGEHGTGVAGCASAVGNNGVGITGAGYSSRILPIKASDDSIATGAVVAGYDAIRYAADMNADIINCSWGGSVTRNLNLQALQQVIDYAGSKNALVIGATGNSGYNNDIFPHVPSNLHNVLAVGATNSLDSVAGFSNYGISADVYAPGAGVLTTTIPEKGGYTSTDGTSFSSPIVAGIAALVMAVHPDWSPEQVALQLRVTGDRVKIPGTAFVPRYYRRVNALAAVQINQNLASNNPDNMPGFALDSYTSVEGATLDTLTTRNSSVQIKLDMTNYLAPSRTLTIDALEGQALTLAREVTVPPSIGTNEQLSTIIEVKVNPNASIPVSQGNLLLVLRLKDGGYEDLIPIEVPVNIPGGWAQHIDPYMSSIATVQGHSIHASGLNAAWGVAAVQAANSFAPTTTFTRTRDGRTWNAFQAIPPGTESIYAVTSTSDRRAWAGSGPSNGQAAVFRTINAGSTWTRVSVSTITPFVNAIHMFDSLNGILLGDPTGNRWGIGMTTDGGVTWTASPNPVAATSSQAGWNNSMAAMGDTLWFGTNSSKIFRSTNRGLTWGSFTTPSVNAMGIDFANFQDGLALFNTGNGATGSNMIAATHDGGMTWTPVSMPFTGAVPHGIAFVPGTSRAFVGTQNGIFETSNYGTSWKAMGVPQLFSYSGLWLSAYADARGSFAVYGINDAGEVISYRELVPDSVSSAPLAPAIATGVTLVGSVPNPASSQASLAFSLEQASSVELSIHAINGSTVLRLPAERYAVGSHSVPVDLSLLPSGTYRIVLKTDAVTVTRPLVIAR